MGKPAAILGSMHICPKTSGNVPHVGGPVIEGSNNVIVGGLPAACKGDRLICTGPPDTIRQGSGSVFINGKPVARRGDATSHGGKIISGNPTVLIGDKYCADKKPPPKTFDEDRKRLEEARLYVNAAREGGAALPGSAYTTADKKEIVKKGLDEPLLFRITKTKYSTDSDYIGYKGEDAETGCYWTTTFTQVEHGDTDPEAICNAVGIDYDSECEYTIILIDHEKAADLGGMHSFIPTYVNMGGHAKSELISEFEGFEGSVEACMTPEYSFYYEMLMVSAKKDGVNLGKQKEFIEYCHKLDFTPSQIDVLRVRYQMDQGLGANEEFLGNGVTKDRNVEYDKTPFGDIDPNLDYGPCETFTWDKNPQTLGELEQLGAISRIKIGNEAT